ncbi:MAG TPA: hypothetical protein VH723_03165 [Candidatus Limnocylindrales bacterium]|jgi:hypothetical protein
MAIKLVGFTDVCRIAGAIPLADDRLSDMLNSVSRVVVRNAEVEEVDGGRVERLDVTVPTGEFLAVGAAGRRGLESQRRKTIKRRVRMGLGRYSVSGYLHVLEAAHNDSLGGKIDALLNGRDLLVPLTEATIGYERAGETREEAWETILINRSRVAWIEAADDEVEPPDGEGDGVRSDRSRFVKDFTGSVAE